MNPIFFFVWPYVCWSIALSAWGITPSDLMDV